MVPQLKNEDRHGKVSKTPRGNRQELDEVKLGHTCMPDLELLHVVSRVMEQGLGSGDDCCKESGTYSI